MLRALPKEVEHLAPPIAAHQRNRALLLLVVEEERTGRKPADKAIAPVLLDNPVLSHAGSYQKLGYCINSTVSMSSDSSFAPWDLVPIQFLSYVKALRRLTRPFRIHRKIMLLDVALDA